jgi:bifunctional non-homologous end joining protein LigD
MTDGTVTIDGHELTLTSPDKVYFPAAPGGEPITKAQVVDYYHRVAERMLPWVRGRPLVLHRFPAGLGGSGFYQKERPDHFPDWIRSAPVPKTGGTTNHVLAGEAATLVYLANFGCIEFHVWPALAERPDHPDLLVFDLDPSRDLEGGGLDDVRHAARLLLALLDELEVPVFVKSSGSRGLHLQVPVDGRADNEGALAFCAAVARRLVDEDPDRLTVEFRKRDRGDRLYVDIGRNGYAQHAAAPYTLRARPGAPVAVPLDRDEATSGRFDPRRITLENVFRRLAQLGDDPWAGFDDRRASLADAARRLERLDR